MADRAIDNDVLFKSVCYGFFEPMIAAIPNGPHAPGILGTARFVLPKLLRKRPPRRLEQAKVELAAALASLEALEPTEDESALAAELEFQAQRQALPVHAGECLLLAIVLTRDLRWLLTGDRSAIGGLARLIFPADIDPAALHGRVMCLEQAICALMGVRDARQVRDAICAEREVDTNLRACFSCASPEVGMPSWREGLESHIQALRSEAGGFLVP